MNRTGDSDSREVYYCLARSLKRRGIVIPSWWDMDEINYFTRILLQPDYLTNFREVMKLYGVRFSDYEMEKCAPAILRYIRTIKYEVVGVRGVNRRYE